MRYNHTQGAILAEFAFGKLYDIRISQSNLMSRNIDILFNGNGAILKIGRSAYNQINILRGVPFLATTKYRLKPIPPRTQLHVFVSQIYSGFIDVAALNLSLSLSHRVLGVLSILSLRILNILSLRILNILNILSILSPLG